MAHGNIEFRLSGDAGGMFQHATAGPSPKTLRKRAKAEERRRANLKATAKAHAKAARDKAKRQKLALDTLAEIAGDSRCSTANRLTAAATILEYRSA